MRSILDSCLARESATIPADEPLVDQVRQALVGCGYDQLRRIRVSATPTGRVRLDGRVGSFYLKQVAQTAALSVLGVKRVENDLQVCAERTVSHS